ncbi:unnamed protein product [Peniophora sp. CBMAI 1063]|nr:unnamed protein product [Peniophora sp. CBMAI 1063]
MSAIAKLSDDDLILIFLHFPVPAPQPDTQAQDRLVSDDGRPSDAADLTWLSISHVCRRWRSISLSCSAIWSTISFTPPESTSAFLGRARDAPLDVYAHWRPGSNGDLMDLAVTEVMSHLDHIRRLSMEGTTHSRLWAVHLPLFASRQAPLLEELRLTTIGSSRELVLLPDYMFEDDMRRLRRVTISGPFSFSFRNNIFSAQLTHLTLSHINRNRRSATAELFELLSRCPLETLSLTASLPSDLRPLGLRGFPDLTEDKVHLSSLKYCLIEDGDAKLASFIRRVELPQACDVFLYIGVRDPIQDTTGIMPEIIITSEAIKGLCELRNELQRPTLHFVQESGSRCLWTWSGELPEHSGSHPTIEVSMGGTSDLHAVHENLGGGGSIGDTLGSLFLLATLQTFPLQSVRALHVSVRTACPDSMWIALAMLPALEDISVCGPSVPGFTKYLMDYAVYAGMLACLERLTLEHADLSSVFNGKVAAAMLETTIIQRGARNASVPRVTLRHCQANPEHLALLEAASGRIRKSSFASGQLRAEASEGTAIL